MRAPLKPIQKLVCAALVAASFLAIPAARADWSNFGTVSMTDAVTPKLTNGYLCYSDGRDIACNTSVGPVHIGMNGLINNGGMTVAGSVSASAVSATYVSATVLQINPSTMPCSTGLNGTIRYSSVSSTLEVCVGTSWTTLSSNTAPGNLSGTGSATAVAFWSGTNSLSYDSGLYWDNGNKRLGVGTSSPGMTLDVSATAANTDTQMRINVQSSGLSYSPILHLNRVGATDWTLRQPVGGYHFVIDQDGARRLTIQTGTGNTGIGGVITPTATLQVSGTFTVSTSVQAGNVPSLYVADNGNVGIGTITPSTQLSIYNSYGGAAAVGSWSWADPFSAADVLVANSIGPSYQFAQAKIQVQRNSNFGQGWNFLVANDSAGSISEVMRITDAGRVGIGTASPASSFTVVNGEIQTASSGVACATATNGGAIRYSAGALYYCNGANTWTALSTGGGTLTGGGSATAIAFWNGPSSLTYESNTTSGLYWDSANGRLGVGTNSPVVGLTISSTSGLAFDSAAAKSISWYTGGGYPVQIRGDASNVYLAFLLSGREAARFNTTGNLGLGTQSPTATLQVSGTFTVSNSTQTATSPSFDVGSNGNVGIGQRAPAGARLKVYGDAVVQGDSSNANIYLQNATNTQTWLLANGGNFSIWDSTAGKGPFIIEPASPNYTFYMKNTGSIGVGTVTPASSLTIVGEAQVGNSGAACVTATNGGAIRYSAGTLYYCNGSNTWTTIGSGGGTLTGGGSATAVAFWNGPNSLTYESATTSGLYWDHTNSRLGIGTNVPTDAIMVSESGTPTIRMRGATGGFVALERNYGTSNFTVGDNIGGMVFSGLSTPQLSGSAAAVKGWFDAAGGTRYKGRLTLETSDGNNIVERMRVDSDGNVGIGMQSATATLQVSGTFTVSNSAQGATSPSIFVSATNGYVGIGTVSPDVPLTVAGATSGSLLHLIRTNSSFNSNIRYESGAGSLYAGAYGLDFRIGMNSDLGISPVAVFTPSNSVGIGTGNGAVPSSLTVVGEAQVGSSGAACVAATNGGAIRYSAGTLYYCNGANTWATIGTGGGTLTGGGSATAVAFWNGASSLTYESATTSGLYWDRANSRLGIGTNTPNEALDVSTTQGRAFFGATVTGGRAGLLIHGYSPGGPYARLESYNYGVSSGIPLLINAVGNGPVGVGALSPTATLQVSGTFTVSQSWQNTASAASMLVDSRGVSVSSIVHINGSAFSPIGAGGNAILSGTTAVSTSSAGSITMYTGGNLAFAVNNNGRVGIKQEPNSFPLAVSGTIFTGRNNTTIEGGEIDLAYPENNGSTNNSMWITDVYGSASSPSYRIFNKSSAGTVVNAVTINNDGTVWVGAASSYPSTQISPNGGIGFNTNASANGYWYAGFYRSGTAIGSISQNGTTAIAYNTTSDRRVKEDITDTRESLQKLMQLPVRDFAFRADPSHTIVTGFIAQELEKVFPEAVTTNGDNGESPLKDKSKPWSVDYGRVTPLIVKAVQELKAANDNLANETAALKSENAALKSANDNMARRLDVLERKVGLQP